MSKHRPEHFAEPGETVSRVFRSSFPAAELGGFRTRSWEGGVSPRPEDLRPLHKTMLHAFAMAAKADDRTGITLVAEDDKQPEEQRSYRQLYHQSTEIAAALLALGVRRGDRVILVLPTSFEFVTAFFGAELAGAIPVPAYPPALLEKAEMALERVQHIAEHASAAFCVTTRQMMPLMGGLALSVKSMRHIVAVEQLGRKPDGAKLRTRVAGKEPAFIQYTSGSTGRPKGVLLAHDNLVANIHAIGQALRISSVDVGVSWLPLYHDMGLIGVLLFCIYWRIPLVLMSPLVFLTRPSRWLWAIHNHRGTLAAAPNFAYALCVKRVRPSDREGLDLSSWRLALNGAEPVNLRTVMQFEETFGPHGFSQRSMLPVYGLAEASLALAFSRPGEPRHYELVRRSTLAAGEAVQASGQDSMAIVSVGTPIPGHEVVVVDEHGEPLADRAVGHVVARGPSLMQGYFQDEKATGAVLRDGWLWTGDLGYYAEGHLFITGRAKDLIIVRGKNYYAEDIERMAERVDGVRAGSVAGFGVYDEAKAQDLVVLVCETKLAGVEERLALVEQISERVRETSGLKIDEVVLVHPGTIPKTSSGKRQRALCREQYLNAELERTRTGKLRLGLVFVRSGAGFLVSRAKRLLASQRAPD